MTYMSKNYFVSKSNIEGTGIFARKSFQKGDIVFILKGNVRHFCPNVDHTKTFCIKCADWVGVGRNTWIDPKIPIKYINHSCNPNVGIKGRVTFHALRDIQEKEELCFDYSTTEEDDVEWHITCRCGYKLCRRKIGGVVDLPDSVFKKYLPYIPKYFQSIYFNAHK